MPLLQIAGKVAATVCWGSAEDGSPLSPQGLAVAMVHSYDEEKLAKRSKFRDHSEGLGLSVAFVIFLYIYIYVYLLPLQRAYAVFLSL